MKKVFLCISALAVMGVCQGQLSDTLSIRQSGCSPKPGFDNAPCLRAALNLAVQTGAAVLCGNDSGTQAPQVYEYQSEVDVHLTKPLRFYGNGSSACILNYTGAATNTGVGMKFWANYLGSDNSKGSMISEITFETSVHLHAVLQLDQLAKGDVDRIVVQVSPTFSGTAPEIGVLGRGWQISSFNRSYIANGFTSGVALTTLVVPDTTDAVAIGLTITSNIASSGGGTFTVSSCAWLASFGVYQYLQFPDGETIKIASCTGTTATIEADCSTTAGYTGNQPCRGSEET